MAKYVAPWNVGGGMKANAYYGSKLMTRRKRRGRKSYRKPSELETNIVSAVLKGVGVVWLLVVLGTVFSSL